jgi:Gas vesicle protein
MTANGGAGDIVRPGTAAARPYGSRVGGGPQPANLGDILERVLDTGIVIAGDIRVNLLDIELLTIKLRLVIASVDTARQLGIDWWQSDPWLSSKGREDAGDRELAEENRRLRERLAAVEGADGGDRPQVEAPAPASRPQVQARASQHSPAPASSDPERRDKRERADTDD